MLQQSRQGAAIIEFPTPPEDMVTTKTGVGLIDADAAVLARLWHRDNWRKRARHLAGWLSNSLDTAVEMSSVAASEDASKRWLAWSIVEMMRKIGEVLDLFDEKQPDSTDSAAWFLLSLNPEHRIAGQAWLTAQGQYWEPLSFFGKAVQKRHRGLAIFYRITHVTHATHYAAWDAGPQEPIDDWFPPMKATG